MSSEKTKSALMDIAHQLSRIADALEQSSNLPCDGILEAYTDSVELVVDSVEYIKMMYGETNERAQEIVANCRNNQEWSGMGHQDCDDELGSTKQ